MRAYLAKKPPTQMQMAAQSVETGLPIIVHRQFFLKSHVDNCLLGQYCILTRATYNLHKTEVDMKKCLLLIVFISIFLVPVLAEDLDFGTAWRGMSSDFQKDILMGTICGLEVSAGLIMIYEQGIENLQNHDEVQLFTLDIAATIAWDCAHHLKINDISKAINEYYIDPAHRNTVINIAIMDILSKGLYGYPKPDPITNYSKAHEGY